MLREVEVPTKEDLAWAKETFSQREPRAVFYRLAIWLMERALAGHPEFSQSEAISVLLLTWNARFYAQRRRRFDEEDYRRLDHLLEKHATSLSDFRSRSITTFAQPDGEPIRELFEDFFRVVGATGVPKALHVCAPRFFPIWDSQIAPKAYGIHRRDAGTYLRLIAMTKEQVEKAGGVEVFDGNPVKLIDEWNYCRYSMGLSREATPTSN